MLPIIIVFCLVNACIAFAPSARKSCMSWAPHNRKLDLRMGLTDEEVAHISYDDYQDRIARILAVKSFVVFKDLDDTEILQLAYALEPVEVSKMQDIITKEDTDDKSMYFVKEGSLQCYDPETKEKFNTVKKGEYVGELALFLSGPRAVSVRAKEDNTILWKLDQKYTSEYPVGKSLSKYLVKQYKTKRSIQYYVDLMKLNLRPKKKKVGPHSTISVLTSGACLLNLVSMFSPALKPIPRIIRYGGMGNVSHMNSLVCSVLLLITAGLGTLRFPPKTKYTRKLIFDCVSIVMVWEFFCIMSNLGGHTSLYFLNAWSWLGRAIFGTIYSTFCLYCFKGFSDIICGEEEGREDVPFFENTLLGIIAFTFFYYSSVEIFLYTAPALIQSKETFLATTNTIYKACKLTPSFWTNALFGGMLYKSLGALVATFQYEKRAPLWKTRASIMFLAWFLIADIFIFPFPAAIGGSMTTELMKLHLSYFKNPVTWPILVAPVAGLAHGIFERIKNGGLKKSAA